MLSEYSVELLKKTILTRLIDKQEEYKGALKQETYTGVSTRRVEIGKELEHLDKLLIMFERLV